MAIDNAKQSRLDKEGIEYRKDRIPGKNKFINELNEYDGDNDEALSHDDENHPWGKGTGKSMGFAIKKPITNGLPGYQNHDYNRSNVNTKDGGGSYDKFGTKGVDKAFQGDAGRNYLQKLNTYGPEAEYGKESVDIDTAVKGQFVN